MPLINATGLQRLGSLNFAANGASQGPITIAACKLIIIEYVITGYTGADVAMFQFNGDTTAANYGTGYDAITATANAGTGSFVTTATVVNAGTTAGIPVSGITQTVGRRGTIKISNFSTARKVCTILNQNESTTSTWPIHELSWGEWLNTAAQITQIKMLLKGANSLLAGSGCVIYGDNY